MSQRKFAKLQDARVVCLGGTSGIGFTVAEGVVEFGGSVVLASSNQERLDNALSRLRKAYPDASGRISGTVCDVSNASTVEGNVSALFQFATQDGKKIDHIVNTAGGLDQIPSLADISAETALPAAGLTVRYTANMMIGKLAPKYMTGDASNSITFTSGTLTQKPTKGYATRVGFAGSMGSLMRCLAVELAPIRVNEVSPGATKTEQLMSIANEYVLKMFSADTLLKAVGEPEDVAEAYLYLMRDRFITAQRIDTDGGRMMVGTSFS